MRILVVDDHPMVRKGISSTLSFEENVEEIKEASNVMEAMQILSQYSPEIAIVDLRLGREDGLEIVNRAKKMNSITKFIILTSSAQKDDFVRAQEAGVDGYILKDSFTEDIIYAFHVIARGKKYFDPEILQYKMDNAATSNVEELTAREKDVLAELGRGFSNMEIAKDLFISEHTVKKHVSSILAKLSMSHRTQAALFADKSFRIGESSF